MSLVRKVAQDESAPPSRRYDKGEVAMDRKDKMSLSRLGMILGGLVAGIGCGTAMVGYSGWAGIIIGVFGILVSFKAQIVNQDNDNCVLTKGK